jgi:hypothetical protein
MGEQLRQASVQRSASQHPITAANHIGSRHTAKASTLLCLACLGHASGPVDWRRRAEPWPWSGAVLGALASECACAVATAHIAALLILSSVAGWMLRHAEDSFELADTLLSAQSPHHLPASAARVTLARGAGAVRLAVLQLTQHPRFCTTWTPLQRHLPR